MGRGMGGGMVRSGSRSIECNGCGQCIQQCPQSAISLRSN
jgi:ferredoxin